MLQPPDNNSPPSGNGLKALGTIPEHNDDDDSIRSSESSLCKHFTKKLHVSTPTIEEDDGAYYMAAAKPHIPLPTPEGYDPTNPRNDYERFLINKYNVLKKLRSLYPFDSGYNDPRFVTWAHNITEHLQGEQFPKETWFAVIPSLLTGKAQARYKERLAQLKTKQMDWGTFCTTFHSRTDTTDYYIKRHVYSLNFRMNGTPANIIKAFQQIVKPQSPEDVVFYIEHFIRMMPARCQQKMREGLKGIVEPSLEAVYNIFLKKCRCAIYTHDHMPYEYAPGFKPYAAVQAKVASKGLLPPPKNYQAQNRYSKAPAKAPATRTFVPYNAYRQQPATQNKYAPHNRPPQRPAKQQEQSKSTTAYIRQMENELKELRSQIANKGSNARRPATRRTGKSGSAKIVYMAEDGTVFEDPDQQPIL